MKNSRSFYKKAAGKLGLILLLAISPLISGCVSTTIAVANAIDQSSRKSATDKQRAKQIEEIKRLMREGDPLGDYLYAVANASGWWSENPIKDPIAIKELYQKAADKGSSDAMIVLGLMLFDGGAFPQYSKIKPLSSELINQKLGLELVDKGMQKRCSYIAPVVSSNSYCYIHYSPAGWIWPDFRDGVHKKNIDGSYTLVREKNSDLEKYWHDKDIACKASEPVQRTKNICRY